MAHPAGCDAVLGYDVGGRLQAGRSPLHLPRQPGEEEPMTTANPARTSALQSWQWPAACDRPRVSAPVFLSGPGTPQSATRDPCAFHARGWI
jgi:hypothetical protein